MARLFAIIVIIAGLFLASEIHEKGLVGALTPWARADLQPTQPAPTPVVEKSRPTARDVLLEAGPIPRRAFDSGDRPSGPTSFSGYAKTKGDALQRRADRYEDR